MHKGENIMTKNPKKVRTFCIISDEDGHNYVCPTDKVEDAYEYFKFVSDDLVNEKFDEEPEWLISVNGPVEKVHFSHFEIKD